MQPADPKLVTKLTSENVEDANGHSALLTADEPIMFFAYWYGHCHDAIEQLKSVGYASKLNFVSSQLQYGQRNMNPDIKQAAQLTNASFTKRNIKEPSNMFFAMPGTPMSNALAQQPVPFHLLHTKQGWYTMTGVPNNKDVWIQMLSYVTNRCFNSLFDFFSCRCSGF